VKKKQQSINHEALITEKSVINHHLYLRTNSNALTSMRLSFAVIHALHHNKRLRLCNDYVTIV